MRHHRRNKNSFACLRSTTSNCYAQLFQNSSLSFFSVYASAIRSSLTNSRTDPFSPSILYSSKNLFILGNVKCYHLLWDSKGSSDSVGRKYLLESSLLISFLSITLTYLFFPVASLAVGTSLIFSLLPSLSPSLALERSFRTWVLITSNSTDYPSFFAIPPQRTSSFLQFLERSLG